MKHSLNLPTILFLEDDKTVAYTFRKQLENIFNVLLAESVVEAQRIVENYSVEVIVADHALPVESGIDFLERIKVQYPDIIRIVMTGIKDLNVAIDAINKGHVYHFFTKPWIKEEVSSVINNALKTKKLNDRLQFMESQFKETFEQSAVGMAWLRLDLDFLNLNPKICEITGYSQEELLEKSLLDLLVYKTSAISRNQLAEEIKRNLPYEQFQTLIKKKDGGIIWGRITASYVYDRDNNPTHIVGTLEDISELKQTSTRLQESEQRFRDISYSLADWIWEVNLEGKFTFVAGDTETNFEYKAEELIGRTPFEFMAQEHAVHSQEIFADAIAKQQNIKDMENWVVSKSGVKICFLTSGVPLFDKKGNLNGYRGVGKDITSLKKAEEQLSRYNQDLEKIIEERTGELHKLSQVVEQSPNAVMITNVKGEIEYANPKFLETSGYSEKEFIGVIPEFLKPGIHSDDFVQSLWNTLLVGKVWQGDIPNKMKNGNIIWENNTISPIRNKDGSITHFVAIKVDITTKKQTEEKLKEQVEQLAKSRKAMLNMMEDLDAAKNEAELATKAKSAFLANMSHEIRSPMNAVLGFLKLTLEDQKLDEKHYKNLMIAYHSASDLLSLINAILDTSKLESGKMELDEVPFFLNKLVNETLSILSGNADEKGLKLNLELAPDLPKMVLGDPLRLKQILLNLIGNAVKFTKKGGITIQVQHWDEFNMVKFSITDTGIGISEDRIDKIFEPFIQEDSTTSRRYGGTGLGTSISRQLVQLMNGKIWVESQVGIGTTFHFVIPLPETDLIPDDASFPKILAEKSDVRTFRCFTILMAEDMETNRTLATIRLEDQGHKLFLAKNGIEALEIFQKEDIDLILMDIQMPKMDGIEATMRIREAEKGLDKRVPVIALTASVMEEDVKLYSENGFDAMAAKPVDFDRLYILMEKLVPQGYGTVMNESISSYMASSREKFPEIYGVDVKKAWKTWQNTKTYLKALRRFIEDHENAVDILSQHLNQEELDEAIKYCHAIKGVSGNLFLDPLAEIIKKISGYLNAENINEALSFFPRVKEELAKLKTAVSIVKIDKEEDHFQGVIDKSKISSVLNSMIVAFNEYNPDVLKPYISELKHFLSDEQINNITRQIDRFNFDAAKNETKELLIRLDHISI